MAAEDSDLSRIRATFPLDDRTIVVLMEPRAFSELPGSASYALASGLEVRDARPHTGRADAVLLTVEGIKSSPIRVDQIVVQLGSNRAEALVGPTFIHGIQTPPQLKVPHVHDRFPFTSRLVGHHVSVMCCTGCNGGVHDRGLVVVNSHIGGPWSGIWVRTNQTLETPYPRWQRALFAGGVLADHSGSTVVEDHGWMVVTKQDEPAHHAPPPLRLSTADLPMKRNDSLEAKGLDGAWVQFDDLLVESAEVVAASRMGEGRLDYNEVIVTNGSGGRTVAWLYQERGLAIQPKQRLAQLRGFVHAEQPGLYVVLSDKDEDLVY